MHECDDGQEQWIDSQIRHARIGINGLDQLIRLRIRQTQYFRRIALRQSHFHHARPIPDKLAHFRGTEIADLRQSELRANAGGAFVTDRAAGDNKTTLGITLREFFDQPRHTLAQGRVCHFIHAIQQKDGMAFFKIGAEKITGQVDLL